MKKHFFIPFFAAVLMGLSAVVVSESATITAEARFTVGGTTTEGLQYYYAATEGSEVTICGYVGTSQKVEIPSEIDSRKVAVILDEAFSPEVNGSYQPANITEVSIPNTVKTIGYRAFFKVPIKKLSLPAGVQSVGEDAFANCDDLTEVIINGKTTLDIWAFDGCEKLKTVDIKDSAILGEESFVNCRSLESVKIRKASELGTEAFRNCKKLRSVNIHSGCTFGDDVFTDCPSLQTLNGHSVIKYSTGSNGVKQPYFNYDSTVRDIVRYTFTKCSNVGFLHKYCTDLCTYIVSNETDPWMSEAIKARQLHDWLIRCCDYDPREDMDNPPSYRENHSAYSVFVSYGLDGHGKTVCEGFSKAYTMLLKTAKIESYVLWGQARISGKSNHIWNLVKIGNRYYQCDVTWDNTRYDNGNSVLLGTNYRYYMKNNYDMHQLHRFNGQQAYYNPKVNKYYASEHDLLVYDGTKEDQVLSDSIYTPPSSVLDTNGDGIRDDDYDLDGLGGNEDYWEDQLARQQLAATIYGYDADINSKLSSLVYRRHLEYVVRSMGY